MAFKPAILLKIYFLPVAVFMASTLAAQTKLQTIDSLKDQKDIKSGLDALFSKKGPERKTDDQRNLNWSVLPSAAYNPSVGFAVGAIASMGKTFGNPATTTLSVINAGAYISTKGLSTFELKHNAFSPDNGWNYQGGVQFGKTVSLDNGLGTGSKSQSDGSFSINNIVFDDNSNTFPVRYTYLKLNERVYRKLTENFYAGAGFSFNIYDNIDNERKSIREEMDHNFRYSLKNGYSPAEYSSNGFLLNLQYNSRDQPNRAFKGIYADVVLKVNQTWLGSEHVAEQLRVEFRKYWSLSDKNPETVLGFWHWANYLLGGSVPYLDLPGTGSDTYNRGGRGYIIGRFKGISFVYNEAEFRFPITYNKLLSGVTFINAETGSNQRGVKLFTNWAPGGGAGLRLLFNKYTRSNLCIDYARGSYGSNGLFLGLNEVF